MNAVAPYAARRPMPAAVVAGVEGSGAVAAIRSLVRAGLPVVAVDHRREALRFGRREAFSLLAPDPLADPGRFLDGLRALGDELGRAAPLFPGNDETLRALVHGRDALGDRFRSPFPDGDVVAAVQDRRRQLERARALGISAPRSADAPTGELGFPVLVKPSRPAGFRRELGRRWLRCETRGELDEAFARAGPFDPLAEELVPGADRETSLVASYLTPGGEALVFVCPRRPARADARTLRAAERAGSADLVEQALALLRDVGFHGLSEVAFARDSRDGRYKLVDVQPRLSQSHALAVAAGADLPRAAYWSLLGARLSAAPRSGIGSGWRTADGGALTTVGGRVTGGRHAARDARRPVLAAAGTLVRRRWS